MPTEGFVCFCPANVLVQELLPTFSVTFADFSFGKKWREIANKQQSQRKYLWKKHFVRALVHAGSSSGGSRSASRQA
jgi:hypothetical protein